MDIQYHPLAALSRDVLAAVRRNPRRARFAALVALKEMQMAKEFRQLYQPPTRVPKWIERVWRWL